MSNVLFMLLTPLTRSLPIYIFVLGGDCMFKLKREQRVLELNAAERRLLILAMMHFRNKLTAQNRPTEDVNELLLRVL